MARTVGRCRRPDAGAARRLLDEIEARPEKVGGEQGSGELKPRLAKKRMVARKQLIENKAAPLSKEWDIWRDGADGCSGPTGVW